MNIPISYFLAKPYYFRNREVLTARKDELLSCVVDEEQKTSLIKLVQKSSKSGKIYTLFIELDTIDTITASTKVKVRCECANFKYQCQTLLWKYDALYGDVEDKRPPKKQSKPYICKHLYAAIVLLLKLNSVNTIKTLTGDK